MNDVSRLEARTAEKPVLIPIEAYVSKDYARAEGEKLWPKVWQVACRVEEIPKVGDYVTYDILDESILVVRTAKDRIQAFFNVCQHRGRRLTEGCGHTAQFYCRFHGWRWELNGDNAFVLDPEDWQGVLNKDNLRLKAVKVDTWGGFVWINMDSDAEPLLDYLKPAAPMLDCFELDKMRYSWRQRMVYPCNWKVGLEAFNESYHAAISHPQLTEWGTFKHWSRGEGRHGWHGLLGPRADTAGAGETGGGTLRLKAGQDPRQAPAEMLQELWNTCPGVTTPSILDVAKRLVKEVPAEASPEQVLHHMMSTVQAEDAARGVPWPQIEPAHAADVGVDWHVFPNLVVLPAPTYALCYRTRPNGYDPDTCIFEAFSLERYPEGEEPKTEWVEAPDASQDRWRLILSQDFGNMVQVQKGMKSRGFIGARPNPLEETAVTHFHRTLAKYMGAGEPVPLKA
jgi:phenylpropionate dioxygenase-like ring-hydroxylating dioxygenase large terminal subunit